MNRTVGVLTLTGREDLFPIDGQHRVAGIKLAVTDDPGISDDEVAVILVGHTRTDSGKALTRRLFVTLNKSARKVSQRDIVALDEDNGLAVVARNMIDDFDLFQGGDLVSFSGSVAIAEKDVGAITSIIGAYQIVKALYPRSSEDWPKRIAVMRARPPDEVVSRIYELCCNYWNLLCDNVKEYRAVLRQGEVLPSKYRTVRQNHLLFRPAGQTAFARATECLMGRGRSLDQAVRLLAKRANVWLQHRDWHSILWDPINKKMLNDQTTAETLLLEYVGEEARSPAGKEKLERIRRERDRE